MTQVVEELRRSDLFYPKIEQHSDFLISVRDIVGTVAKFAIFQSPYVVPSNLEKVCKKLYDALFKAASANPNFECTREFAPIQFRDVGHLRNVIRNYLHDIPEYMEWNERKNGNQALFNFTSAFDGPKDPDDDFIDLGALEGNVALMLAQHSALSRNFDQLHEQANPSEVGR